MITIRKAELRDVPSLYQMINRYVTEGVVLPRPLQDLYENVWEFTVAEKDGQVLGCGALKLYSQELAEVRSLCVAAESQANGVGRALTESLLEEAERFGLKTVFALTVAPGFFERSGFREVARETFPTKVWRDCVTCPRYTCCNEKTVALNLPRAEARVQDASPEKSEVPV